MNELNILKEIAGRILNGIDEEVVERVPKYLPKKLLKSLPKEFVKGLSINREDSKRGSVCGIWPKFFFIYEKSQNNLAKKILEMFSKQLLMKITFPKEITRSIFKGIFQEVSKVITKEMSKAISCEISELPMEY